MEVGLIQIHQKDTTKVMTQSQEKTDSMQLIDSLISLSLIIFFKSEFLNNVVGLFD
jgi:hypothetical protein